MHYLILVGMFAMVAGQNAAYQVAQYKPPRLPGQEQTTSLPLDGASTQRPSPRFRPTTTEDVNKMKLRILWWIKMQMIKFCPCQNKPGEERENNEDPTRNENMRNNKPLASLKERISNRWKSSNIFGNNKAAIPAWQTNSKPGKHAAKSEEKSRDKTRGKGKNGNIRTSISTKRKDTNPTQKARGKPNRNAGILDDKNENGVRKPGVWNRKRGMGSINDAKSGPNKEGEPGKIRGKSGTPAGKGSASKLRA